MECQLCGNEVEKLNHTRYSDDSKLMICDVCLGKEESRGDFLYDQMRENEFEAKREKEREEGYV